MIAEETEAEIFEKYNKLIHEDASKSEESFIQTAIEGLFILGIKVDIDYKLIKHKMKRGTIMRNIYYNYKDDHSLGKWNKKEEVSAFTCRQYFMRALIAYKYPLLDDLMIKSIAEEVDSGGSGPYYIHSFTLAIHNMVNLYITGNKSARPWMTFSPNEKLWHQILNNYKRNPPPFFKLIERVGLLMALLGWDTSMKDKDGNTNEEYDSRENLLKLYAPLLLEDGWKDLPRLSADECLKVFVAQHIYHLTKNEYSQRSMRFETFQAAAVLAKKPATIHELDKVTKETLDRFKKLYEYFKLLPKTKTRGSTLLEIINTAIQAIGCNCILNAGTDEAAEKAFHAYEHRKRSGESFKPTYSAHKTFEALYNYTFHNHPNFTSLEWRELFVLEHLVTDHTSNSKWPVSDAKWLVSQCSGNYFDLMNVTKEFAALSIDKRRVFKSGRKIGQYLSLFTPYDSAEMEHSDVSWLLERFGEDDIIAETKEFASVPMKDREKHKSGKGPEPKTGTRTETESSTMDIDSNADMIDIFFKDWYEFKAKEKQSKRATLMFLENVFEVFGCIPIFEDRRLYDNADNYKNTFESLKPGEEIKMNTSEEGTLDRTVFLDRIRKTPVRKCDHGKHSTKLYGLHAKIGRKLSAIPTNFDEFDQLDSLTILAADYMRVLCPELSNRRILLEAQQILNKRPCDLYALRTAAIEFAVEIANNMDESDEENHQMDES